MWYTQVMGANYPGTTYTRDHTEIQFGWTDAGNGDLGVVGTLSGKARLSHGGSPPGD